MKAIALVSALLPAALGQGMVTQADIDKMRSYFEANIDSSSPDSSQTAAKGCVFAAPSNKDPTYLYHWQRDAAISMNVWSSLL